MGRKRSIASIMRKLFIILSLLLTASICHAAYKTDNITITALPSKTSLATDVDGKVIAGSAIFTESDPLSLHLNGDNANGYLYLDTNKYLKKIDENTVGLYVNSILIQDWSITAAAPPAGSYMSFGCLCY